MAVCLTYPDKVTCFSCILKWSLHCCHCQIRKEWLGWNYHWTWYHEGFKGNIWWPVVQLITKCYNGNDPKNMVSRTAQVLKRLILWKKERNGCAQKESDMWQGFPWWCLYLWSLLLQVFAQLLFIFGMLDRNKCVDCNDKLGGVLIATTKQMIYTLALIYPIAVETGYQQGSDASWCSIFSHIEISENHKSKSRFQLNLFYHFHWKSSIFCWQKMYMQS